MLTIKNIFIVFLLAGLPGILFADYAINIIPIKTEMNAKQEINKKDTGKSLTEKNKNSSFSSTYINCYKVYNVSNVWIPQIQNRYGQYRSDMKRNKDDFKNTCYVRSKPPQIK